MTKKVLFALTGDILNSDRRLDEILVNSTNRASACIGAVRLLADAMLDIESQGFDVTFTYVCGNESRIDLDMGNINVLSSNNFDDIICDMLGLYLPKSIKYIKPKQSLANVIEVNGKNILLTHGINLKKNPQQAITMITANYCRANIKIDYTLCGHIHEALISDYFGRSAGLVGSNDYSVSVLNLHGRASQNCYIVSKKGITAIKNDLQDTTIKGYPVDDCYKTYKVKETVGNVIINKVLV